MRADADHPPRGQAANEPGHEPLVTLPPSLSARAALKRIHARLLQRIRDNEAGVREARGGEYLHDFRVAVRRTRTGLQRVKGVYPKPAADRFAGDFRWLSKTTGPARDLQVYLRSFERFEADLGAGVVGRLEPLAAFLRSQQEAENERCTSALASARYGELQREWQQFLERPDDTGDGAPNGSQPTARDDGAPNASQPAAGDDDASNALQSAAGDDAPNASLPVHEVGTSSIERAFRRAAKHGAALQIDSAGTAFHRVRLDFKKLRYLLEFFGSLFPEERSKRAIATLKQTQDTLGAINDLRVQSEWLDRSPAPENAATHRLRAYLGDRQESERRLLLERFAELLDSHCDESLPGLLGIDAASH